MMSDLMNVVAVELLNNSRSYIRRKGSVTVVETLHLSCLVVSLPTSFLCDLAIQHGSGDSTSRLVLGGITAAIAMWTTMHTWIDGWMEVIVMVIGDERDGDVVVVIDVTG